MNILSQPIADRVEGTLMGSAELPVTHDRSGAFLVRLEEGGQCEIPELAPRFRLSTLLLAVTSSAICLAIARSIPELAIGLVFVMAIAMIRLLYGIQFHVISSARLTFRGELLLYLKSILVVIAIGGFVISAFVLALGGCVGAGLFMAANAESRKTEWVFGGFITGWILGLVAAFFTGGWLANALWFTNLGPVVRSTPLSE
jgi:hypothetical protein